MDELIQPAVVLLHFQVARARSALYERRHATGADAGVSTLEMVIIALGLMAAAGLLVAAITTAVTRRTNEIK
ncbi:MAG: hypothetical protein ACOYXW_17245 [Actinomycetota bacterium]